MRRIKKGLITGTAMTAGLGTSVSAFTLGGDNGETEEVVPEVATETAEGSSDSWWDNAPEASEGTVTDDMDFSDAFGAARKELGAGGVFTWDGKLFSTFYKEECDEDGNPLPEFLPDEVADHSDSDDNDSADSSSTSKDDKEEKEDKADKGDEEEDDKKDLADNTEGDAKDVVKDLDKEDVNILSMDSDGDGYAEKVYVDVNKDGIADILMDDTDGDGSVGKDEVIVLDEAALAADAEKGDAKGDVLSVDYSGDGVADTQIVDLSGDGIADTMAQDLDQDGVITADNDIQIDIESNGIDGSLADNQSFDDTLNNLSEPVELVADSSDASAEDTPIITETDTDTDDLLADASDDADDMDADDDSDDGDDDLFA